MSSATRRTEQAPFRVVRAYSSKSGLTSALYVPGGKPSHVWVMCTSGSANAAMASLRSRSNHSGGWRSSRPMSAARCRAARASKRCPGRRLWRVPWAWPTRASASRSRAARPAAAVSSNAACRLSAASVDTVATAASNTITAASRVATAGLRRHQRQARSAGPARRARTGRSARNRRKSSASASAVA